VQHGQFASPGGLPGGQDRVSAPQEGIKRGIYIVYKAKAYMGENFGIRHKKTKFAHLKRKKYNLNGKSAIDKRLTGLLRTYLWK